MNAKTMALGVRNRLSTVRMWSRRQIVGESVLAVVLALGMAASQTAEGPLWMTVAALAAAVLSPLRRIFPAGVLVATGAIGGLLSGFGIALLVMSWSAGARNGPGWSAAW
ncbi:hypothetical protein JHN63_01190 [Streptomyces sp. MBT65]|uniref:hypothetical protein n=1 Tax=Streptomyces sp. MBT65 TaxID=1488395 RepID=UPI00190CAFFE|nr:hypothetical protein [Streptomyces sp. MBT65]MBK3572459.1 hypothetical protein [Streptomyces sp. MBT65]